MGTEERFYCPHCETGTRGEKVCENCGLVRPIQEGNRLFFCPRCNEPSKGIEFCAGCGAKRKVEEKEVSRPAEIVRFKIEISRRLYLDPVLAKETEELANALKVIQSEGRRLFELERQADADRELREFSESIMAKYSFDREGLSDTQKVDLIVRNQTAGPHDVLNQAAEGLHAKLETLLKPVRDQLASILDETIQKVSADRHVRTLGPPRTDDRGRELFKIESNLKAIEKIVSLLTGFKNSVRHRMTNVSFTEITDMVKGLETEVNEIDFSMLEKEEVTESRWRDIQESLRGERTPPPPDPTKAIIEQGDRIVDALNLKKDIETLQKDTDAVKGHLFKSPMSPLNRR